MRTFENLVATFLVLLAPGGLLYGWYFYLTRLRHEPGSWRKWVSVSSLAVASLAALSWLVMVMLMPRADWGTGAGVDYQMRWVEGWYKPIFVSLVGSLVLCLFGRPRMIVPIAGACVGTALFWMLSTMP